jgi:hypothetical protein
LIKYFIPVQAIKKKDDLPDHLVSIFVSGIRFQIKLVI